MLALLYASLSWLSRGSQDTVGDLKGDYLDPALLAGPVLGVIAWTLTSDYEYARARLNQDEAASWPKAFKQGFAIALPAIWLITNYWLFLGLVRAF